MRAKNINSKPNGSLKRVSTIKPSEKASVTNISIQWTIIGLVFKVREGSLSWICWKDLIILYTENTVIQMIDPFSSSQKILYMLKIAICEPISQLIELVSPYPGNMNIEIVTTPIVATTNVTKMPQKSLFNCFLLIKSGYFEKLIALSMYFTPKSQSWSWLKNQKNTPISVM